MLTRLARGGAVQWRMDGVAVRHGGKDSQVAGTLVNAERVARAQPAQRRVARAQPAQRRVAGLPHLVGLDGIRAIAVLAVILYHADARWLPGGFLGVDVFFVLSGFLITSLLLVELGRTGRIDFGQFYLRRARRLLPALFAVLLACSFLVAFGAPDSAAGFRHDLPGALLYYSNWLNIFSDSSYFQFIGRPPLLQHLWSLAVEEQFYLLWPLAVLLLHRLRGVRLVGRVALAGALLSALAMLIGSLLWSMPMPNDASRLYFGTDTHAMGVLVGAALAVVWRPGNTRPDLPAQARRVITAAGVAALLALLAAFVVFGEYSIFLYRGGFLVVSLVTAVAVAAASHRGVGFGRVLGVRPLRYLGERSYGLYLWHWPLFLVLRPGQDIPLTGWSAATLRLSLLLLVAELSYRWLELPIRRGGLGKLAAMLRAGQIHRPRPIGFALLGALLALLGWVGFRVATTPAPVLDLAGESAPLEAAVGVGLPPGSLLPDRVELVAAATRPELNWAQRARAAQDVGGTEATAFGDSVLLGASTALEQGPFDLDLHARIAEQASVTAGDVLAQAEAGFAPVVILHTGNNGIMTADTLRAMLDTLAHVPRVVLVNTNLPRPWSEPNNRVIGEVAAGRPNVRVVDWHALSHDHPEFFVSDGVHLTWVGATVYAKAIEAAATGS